MERRGYDIEHIERHQTERQVEDVTIDSPATRNAGLRRIIEAVWFVFGIVEVLIAIRFVLRLLGANPAADFAAAIYAVTAPFVAPFVGIFGTPQFAGSVVEPHSLVALWIYAALGWGVGRLLWLMFADTAERVETTTRTARSEREHEHDLAA
jgi:hypothetical protein